MADVSVRPARPGDESRIAEVQLAAWGAGYAAVLPGESLAGGPAHLEAWRVAVSAPPSPRHRVLVAAERNLVVGFAAVTPLEQELGELTALHVAPGHVRSGHGSRLLAACVDGWRLDGVARALTWVFTADLPVRVFLEAAGWAAEGAFRTVDTGAGEHRQERLHVALGG